MTEVDDRLDQLIRRTRNLPHRLAVQQVHEHFGQMPDGASRALVQTRARQVAALDGAPPWLRYHASLLVLAASRRRLRGLKSNGRASRADLTRLATVEDMLRPVGHDLLVDTAGQRVVVPVSRQFLCVEVEGQGRLVEVVGDLEQARNVVVLVPGMYNNLEKARSQVDRAENLKTGIGPDTAVVMWKNYTAPMNVQEGMFASYADAALPALSRFGAGLDVVRSPDSQTMFIGNSYGSLVVGRALMAAAADSESQLGVSPTIGLLTGSPGVDPSVTSVAQITPEGTTVLVGRAPGDYVSYLRHHGPDPADFEGMFRFATGNENSEIHGHMGYFTPGSEAFENICRAGRGELGLVTRAPRTTPTEEAAWAAALNQVGNSQAKIPIAKVFDGAVWLNKQLAPAKTRPLDDGRRLHLRPSRPEGRTR